MKLFVDTSAFYALEDANDQHHEEARSIQRWCLKARPLFFTTHHILDESITLIGSKLRPNLAIRFGRQLLSSRIVRIIRSDEELEEAALNVYERFKDPRLSFTDCLSFAVMRALDIKKAFTFDRHFEQAGFEKMRVQPP